MAAGAAGGDDAELGHGVSVHGIASDPVSHLLFFVIPGLVPGIHAPGVGSRAFTVKLEFMDSRHKA